MKLLMKYSLQGLISDIDLTKVDGLNDITQVTMLCFGSKLSSSKFKNSGNDLAEISVSQLPVGSSYH